jgi:L-asparaginase
MRNADQPGADGPANLLSAVHVASSPTARDLGALVCFADEIHAARYVRKIDSIRTSAIASPGTGPVGLVVEGTARFHYRFDRTPTVPLPLSRPARVELVTASLGSDGVMLDLLLGHREMPEVDGIVVAAFGAGHVPSSWVGRLETLAARIPVVLSSRTGGSVLSRTYGFAGSERDLLGRGLISGGCLDPYKARLLLLAHLAAEGDHEAIESAFANYR